MADLIELVCECGKVLKVPRARAGQQGKCARCKRVVTIPLAPDVPAEPTAPGFGQSPPSSGFGQTPNSSFGQSPVAPSFGPAAPTFGQGQENLESLRDTAVRMPPPVSNETVSPFGGGWAGAQPPSPATQRREPFAVPATQSAAIPCPRCGDMNVADAEICANCGENFYNDMAVASGQPVAVTTKRKAPAASFASPTKKRTKPKKSKFTSGPSYVTVIAIFLFGFIAGLALGPGYANMIPGLTAFSKEQIPEQVDEIPDSTPVVDKPDNKPEEVVVDDTKPEDTTPKPEKVPVKPQYDLKLKSKVDEALEDIDVYLSALDSAYGPLQQNKSSLDRKYPGIYMPKVEDTINDFTKMKKGLKGVVRYAKQIYSLKRWDLLPKAWKYVKRYKGINPEKSRLMYSLRLAAKKVKEKYDIFETHSRKQNQAGQAGSVYLGRWYKRMMKSIKKLNKLFEQNFSVTSTGASIRLQRTKVEAKKLQEYSKEIGQVANTLKRVSRQKSVQGWITWRERHAASRPQQRQAVIVRNFVKSGKKFLIDVDSEVSRLSSAVKYFSNDVSSGRVRESTVRRLLKAMQAIDRKYRDKYEDFNSAVTNFEFWTPK